MTRKPDIQGSSGRAWKWAVDQAEMALKPHGLDAYLIHQPGVHTIWSWWWVTGCDLYPDDGEWGRLPAVKVKPENTHEFLCFALNPETGFYKGTEPPDGWDSTDPNVLSRVGRHYMTPPEFVHQDVLRDSEQANEIIRLLIRAMCDGLTYADADYAQKNIHLLAHTCEHFRQGKHDIS